MRGRRRGARRRRRGRRPAARRARRGAARRACRRPSPTRSTARWATSSARYARTHGPFLTAAGRPPRFGVRPSAVPAGARARSRPTGRVVRGEFRPDGVEREWCDDEVLRQLRRRSLAALRARSSRSTADALARFLPAWQGVGVPPAGPRRAGRGARRRSRARPSRRRSLEADVLPARLARLPAGRPRRAVRRGRGRVGRRRRPRRRPTAGSGSCFRDQARRCSSPTADDAARGRRCTTRSAPTSPQRGASFWPDLVRRRRRGRAALRRRRRCSPRCGTWCGRARSPTTRSPRCGRSASARQGPRRRGRRAGRPSATRSADPARARRPAAGRWSLVGPAARARARRPPRRPTPGPCSCSSATACSPARRRWPRGSRAASPASTRCSRRSRSGARCAGATSSPASARAQFALPGAVDRLRSPAATPAERRPDRPLVLAATDPAQPYGAALPGPRRAGPARPRRRRLRGARRRRAGRVPRAGRPQPGHVPGGRRATRLGRRARSPGEGRPAAARSRSPGSTASPSRELARWPTRSAPPASSTATGASSSANVPPAEHPHAEAVRKALSWDFVASHRRPPAGADRPGCRRPAGRGVRDRVGHGTPSVPIRGHDERRRPARSCRAGPPEHR